MLEVCVSVRNESQRKALDWDECMAELMDIGVALTSPSPDTHWCKNKLNNAMRRIRAMSGMSALDQSVAETEFGLSVDDLPDGHPRKVICALIVKASENLVQAHELANKLSNRMAQHLPLFQDLKKTASELNQLPKEIMKIEGLDPMVQEKENE